MKELFYADPEEKGFSREKLSRALKMICSFSEKSLVSGIEILVARSRGIVLHEACGYAQLVPVKRVIRRNMLFDLASLTKALAGSILAGYLVSEGMIHLKQRVSEIIPEFSRTEAGVNETKEKVKIWMLLTHSSGLPAWQPLYKIKSSREEIIREAVRSFPVYEPGSTALYSDLGYIVLTKVIEEVSSERIDRLYEKIVVKRLGLRNTLFNPLKSNIDPEEIVSTEVVDNEALTGVVHDENARAMDGVSAHAGLFSTAIDIAVIAQEIIDSFNERSDLLLPPLYTRAMLDKWVCGDRCYGLGWWVYDRRITESAGDLFQRGYGHTGFTGTSLWIDPSTEIIIVLLTNRVHPSRNNPHINTLRAITHNLVLSSLRKISI